MKRFGNLWDGLASFRNLHAAYRQALRGKRRRPDVAAFEYDAENQLVRLRDELLAGSYRPGPYRTFTILEPKPRLISAAPFRDRVIHHALTRVLEPIFDPRFIADSYACRRAKGTHAAVDRFQQFAKRYPFVLKCDISKYFPSVDHDILRGLIARRVKDRRVLALADTIIAASDPPVEGLAWFPGDDLFTPAEHRRGLPLGNQTSQFFANVYLDPFDQWVKHSLRVRGYVRYVDDFVLFADTAAELHELRDMIRAKLCEWRLTLHPRKAVVSRVADGTRFLGYRVFPTHRLLPRSNVVRMQRRLRRLQRAFTEGELEWPEVRNRLGGWWGHAVRADTTRLREWLFADVRFTPPPVADRCAT